MPCDTRIPEGHALDQNCEALFAKVADWGGRPAADRIARIIGNALRPGISVLDIGTGPGTIPIHLSKRYPEVSFTGLDISIGILQQAVQVDFVHGQAMPLICADAEQLPFRPQSFDVILSFFALHHMDRPHRIFSEINRVLKKEGTLLIIDFRRDMAGFLYHLLNGLWKTAFLFSSGRRGFQDSVQSAWRPGEISDQLEAGGLTRFQIHSNYLELWVWKNLNGTDRRDDNGA